MRRNASCTFFGSQVATSLFPACLHSNVIFRDYVMFNIVIEFEVKCFYCILVIFSFIFYIFYTFLVWQHAGQENLKRGIKDFEALLDAIKAIKISNKSRKSTAKHIQHQYAKLGRICAEIRCCSS